MEKEIKILMLEDMEEDAGLIDEVLQAEKIVFSRVRVDTREEFTDALKKFRPDVVLSDHSLPSFNSIEALKICHENGLNVPFILVTGTVSEEFAVNCLKRGADDYVLKSNLTRLPMAIRYALRRRRQENARKGKEEILRRQNLELTKINQELDSFVYSVSHNLRSPLHSVLGLVNIALMDDDKSNEMVNRYFEMIRKNAARLDTTLQQNLIYSRNARSEVNFSEVDLEQLIRQCFAEFKYLEGNREIKKEIDIRKQAPLYSDSYRLYTILSNLISNAIKYLDETKDQSLIQVVATITPASAIINVRDNGIGIHRDYLPKVFNMFFRATEKREGDGLGLYIVKEMLERLHATVSITSTLGEATDFTLTIPNAGQVLEKKSGENS
jgi:signal transduction histidine kinase